MIYCLYHNDIVPPKEYNIKNNKVFGGFLLRKKQAVQHSAIAPASSVALLPAVAGFAVLPILATRQADLYFHQNFN